MFFKSYLIFIFVKFLWIGLIFGVLRIFKKILCHFCKNNLYISNSLSFLFWIGLGDQFIKLCAEYYDYAFCWFGLIAVFLGLFLVEISLNFFFTKLIFLLYNKLVDYGLRKKNGKHKSIETG